MVTPELFVAMTKVGFMAPDGDCKTFDARPTGSAAVKAVASWLSSD